MGRPSKLSPDQWAEVGRRLIDGESKRALAREYGISDAALRAYIAKLGQTETVQKAAAKLVEAEATIASLPIPAQVSARNLAAKLLAISSNLASAAEHGAATAHRLNALANSEVGKVDDASPLTSLENLRGVGVLTKLANDSASIALNLLAANKETVQKINAQEPDAKPAPVRERLSLADWKAAHGLG